MSLYTGFITFSVIWWTVLFMVLPIGISIPQNSEKGMASSAPSNPMIKKKLMIVTGLSVPLFFLAKWLIDTNMLGI